MPSWSCWPCSPLLTSDTLLSVHALQTPVSLSSLQKVQSEVVLFTAVFVLLTLLVNAPMLPVVLRMTKCANLSLRHFMVLRLHMCPGSFCAQV